MKVFLKKVPKKIVIISISEYKGQILSEIPFSVFCSYRF